MKHLLGLFAVFFVGSALAAGAREAEPPLPVKQHDSAEAKRVESEYRQKYEDYRRHRDPYEAKAAAYWDLIERTRAARRQKRAEGKEIELADYVLDQPPVYSGPPAPAKPPSLREPPPKRKTAPMRPLPVVADFLRHAKKRFKFTPKKPAAEMDYKRAYARAALAAGITREQAVRIYGFEAGGNGGYDVQAGLETNRPGAKPISTALGYNQLLVANTIGILAEHGEEIVAVLQKRMDAAKGARRGELKRKIAAVRRMRKYARSMPYRWSDHVKAATTPKGQALHTLILDIDVGPLLQTQKLLNSLNFLRRKGYERPFSAAELEMMNLMGDGSGFEVVTMPHPIRDKVPTANFFQRGGYERNTVVRRNNVVSSLLAATERKMDYQAGLDGARQLDAAFEEALQSTD